MASCASCAFLAFTVYLRGHARNVVVAVFLADDAADFLHGRRIDVDAVGSHIGNETDRLAADLDAFVKPLRDPHGLGRRKAQFARGFLLQRRGGEGRIGVTLGGLRLDVRDREGRKLQVALEGLGLVALADVETGDLLSVRADEPGIENAAVLGRERRNERPVFLAFEGLDFEFAVADEAQCHRLHTAGRARSGELAPQNRREIEADEIIESAARQIGVDQRLIDLARIAQGGQHGILGDRVEGHALDRNALQNALVVQRFQDVPGDRFAFAIRVGRENELFRALDRPGDIVQPFAAPVVERPDHLEVVFGIDRAVLGRQVADMSEGGQDLVILAEIFVDRLGLGRRLDDEDFHGRLPTIAASERSIVTAKPAASPDCRGGG